MPKLSEDAQALYEKAWGLDTYQRYNDNDNDKFHGRKLREGARAENNTFAEEPFFHRADHDVESMFWSLFTTLLRASPKSDSIVDTTRDQKRFEEVWTLLNDHTITRETDSRDQGICLAAFSPFYFERILHPELHFLAPMMRQLAQQIAPEYAFLQSFPCVEHLHEAMRRILLQTIVEMGDKDVELDPSNPRLQKYVAKGKGDDASRGTKRGRGTNDPNTRASKASRTSYVDNAAHDSSLSFPRPF